MHDESTWAINGVNESKPIKKIPRAVSEYENSFFLLNYVVIDALDRTIVRVYVRKLKRPVLCVCVVFFLFTFNFAKSLERARLRSQKAFGGFAYRSHCDASLAGALKKNDTKKRIYIYLYTGQKVRERKGRERERRTWRATSFLLTREFLDQVYRFICAPCHLFFLCYKARKFGMIRVVVDWLITTVFMKKSVR